MTKRRLDPAQGTATGGWTIETLRSSAQDLHEHPWPDPVTRTVWRCEPHSTTVVLGSTQRRSAEEVVEEPDVGLAVRRSGGGAVVVGPGLGLWVDLLIPAGDPLWHDDVSHSMLWLGRAWVAALAALGTSSSVHTGSARNDDAARLACFAGSAPGEVMMSKHKVVGISQRRTRVGARLQCMIYTGAVPNDALVQALAPLSVPVGGPEVLATLLEDRATAVPHSPDDLFEALMWALADVAVGEGAIRGGGAHR